MKRALFVIAISAIGMLACAESAVAALAGQVRVASGLSSPMFATHAPGDTSRLFIAQRGGAIRILDLNSGSLLTTPFLTMTGVDPAGEGGFLGMAFHPGYSDPLSPGFGKMYVKVTTSGSALTARVREFTVSSTDPNVADPSSLREILSYTNPASNHVGGWIGFGPNDDYLYIANGDGGGSNDTGSGHTSGSGNAQDVTNNWLGKILRVDVNGDDFTTDAARNYGIPATNPFKAGVGSPDDDAGDDEIWAYGLRNPFRASFDRITGDFYIGDVGQDNREEIDFQSAASTGGLNYGWRLREGDIATPTGGVGGAAPVNHTPPVYSYTHPDTTVAPISPTGYNGRLVTGGYVYRGPDPSLQGKYFFLDATTGNTWMADTTPFTNVVNINSQLTKDTGSASFAVSFGEDAKGNLYIVYNSSGEVYRINTNELLPGDYNADGNVDASDYNSWQQTFGTTGSNLAADGNKNGTVDAADYVVWRNNEGASVFTALEMGAAVPEPATIGLLLITAALSCVNSRRRRGGL